MAKYQQDVHCALCNGKKVGTGKGDTEQAAREDARRVLREHFQRTHPNWPAQ